MHRIGIDLGGTKIEGILLDENNNTIYRKRVPTHREDGYKAIINRISILGHELLEKSSGVERIGICTPGSVDPTDNIIFDWGDDVVIEKIDDRTFNFTLDTTDETFNYSHVSTNGVWVAHLGKDGSCCVAFTEAWITLEGLSEVHKEVVKEFRDYVVSNIS